MKSECCHHTIRVRGVVDNPLKYKHENMAAFKGKVISGISDECAPEYYGMPSGAVDFSVYFSVLWTRLNLQVSEKNHVFLVGALWGFRGSRIRASSPPSSQTKWAGSGSSAAVGSSGSCGGTASWSSEENASTSLRRR